MEDSSNCDIDIGCDGESAAMIPNPKTLNIDYPSSSDVKEGIESPLSSWDSEPEKDISPEESLQEWEIDNRSYDELLKKFIEKEEELRVSNLKLQLSEQENIKLAVQVENGKIQIDDVCEKLELKELYEQKKLSEEEIFKLKNQIKESENQVKKEELQKQTVELDTNIPEFINKNTNLMEQLEAAHKKKLKISTDEIAILQKELGSKSFMILRLQCGIREEKEKMAILKSELETLVRKNEDNDINHNEELRKLTSILFDFHVKSSWEKEELNSEISSLSKQKKQLTSKLENCESRNKKLEEKIMQYIAEKQKQKKLLSTEHMFLQDEISKLKKKKRIDERMNDVEASNIDETDVKIDEVEAEMCSCHDQISRVMIYTDRINTLQMERRMMDYSGKLKLKVEELEKEVTEENGVIMDMAEEKKEAIGELCKSLEHYRSGYNEVIRAYERLYASWRIAKLNEENKLKLRVEELEEEVSDQNGVILDMAEEKKEAIRDLCNSLEFYRSGYNEVMQALNGL